VSPSFFLSLLSQLTFPDYLLQMLTEKNLKFSLLILPWEQENHIATIVVSWKWF
jgi:hypothetical protein